MGLHNRGYGTARVRPRPYGRATAILLPTGEMISGVGGLPQRANSLASHNGGRHEGPGVPLDGSFGSRRLSRQRKLYLGRSHRSGPSSPRGRRPTVVHCLRIVGLTSDFQLTHTHVADSGTTPLARAFASMTAWIHAARPVSTWSKNSEKPGSATYIRPRHTCIESVQSK